MPDDIMGILKHNKGKIIGAIIGLIIGWIILSKGMIAAALILVCIALGYYLGSRVDNNEDLFEIFSRFLPPYSR